MIISNETFDVDVLNLYLVLSSEYRTNKDYERERSYLIEKHGMDTFRDIQRVAFAIICDCSNKSNSDKLKQAYITASKIFKD